MKSFSYALRYLLRSPSTQAIKVASLSLGLAAGLLIFAKVAFERSYDNFFPDADRLYQLKGLYPIDDGSGRNEESDMLFGPLAPLLAQNIPAIESATRTFWLWTQEYFHDDRFYNLSTILADTCLFDVLDYGMVQGDAKALRDGDAALISRSAAARLFGQGDPIGRTILYDKRIPITIRGVFEDVPANSQVRFELILSLAGMDRITGWGDAENWDGGDSFRTYLRLRPDASMEQVEAMILPVAKASPLRGVIDDFSIDFLLRPIAKSYLHEGGRGAIAGLLMALAFLVLFISAMNYVLISISSLERRMKAIAVQKCNGARTGTIFGQFLIETGLLIAVSLALCAFLFAAFEQQIALLTGQTLAQLFVPAQWLRIGAVVVGFFLLAGVIPGHIFSRIPVAYAFKPAASGKRWWKQLLVFLQLLCATFVLIFLVVVIRQYHLIANRSMGYDYENVVDFQLKNTTPASYGRIRQQLATLPFVENMALAEHTLTTGLSGLPIRLPGNGELISSRQLSVEPGFLELMRIAMASGEPFPEQGFGPTQVIVNERLAGIMGWSAQQAVGKTLDVDWHGSPGLEVIGVTRDFYASGWASGDLQPLVVLPRPWNDTTASGRVTGMLHIRLNDLNTSHLAELQAKLQELLPDQQVALDPYVDDLYRTASDERMIRNIVLITAAIIFAITLTGLVGYVNDEVRRRRREIAIRRINGASAGQIIALIAGSLLVAGALALACGTAGAWIASSALLQNFGNRIALGVWSFAGGALFVLAVGTAVIVLRSWRAAHENPSRTLKTE